MRHPTHPHRKRRRIPRLDKYRPRPRKLTDQTLTGADPADDAPRSDAFHDVFAVPRDEVAVVDDVFFAVLEL